MKFIQLLKSSVGIKRWIFTVILGIFAVAAGIVIIYEKIFYTTAINYVVSILVIAAGFIFIYIAVVNIIKSVLNLAETKNFNNGMDYKKIKRIIYKKAVLNSGPNIVVIGGGTGLSVLLRGLKQYSSNLTAVVTVSDDGGSSGMLRDDMGILPPGDIRNCVLALADVEPLMEKLIQYRFKEGNLKGQNFGNLFIAALTDITDNFEQAIKEISSVLAVGGKVLPVSLQDIRLNAELEDGFIVKGESSIPLQSSLRQSPIKRVFVTPDNCMPILDVLDAIEKADCIVLGPGSLFTSIVPNFLVNKVSDSISKAKAIKIYVCNIMTQPGETDNFSVSDHVKVIHEYAGRRSIQYVVANNADIPEHILDKYKEDGSIPVQHDVEQLKRLGVELVEQDFLDISDGLIRHNSNKLAKTIIKLVYDKKL
ncbi:MAG: YvcK family protein [Clostridia bacterium]|nr:YvcK family protein [Clostridia bacterium]